MPENEKRNRGSRSAMGEVCAALVRGALPARCSLVLICENSNGTPARSATPPAIAARLAVGDVAELGLPGRSDLAVGPGVRPADVTAPPGSGAFCWTWRVPDRQ